MECHRCEHNGKLKGRSYFDSPCATCELTESSLGTLEFEESRSTGPIRWPPPIETEVADQLPISVLVDVVKLLGGLSSREFYILRSRYRGETLPEIAQHLGVGVYEVRAQLRKLLRKAPVLKKLIPALRARKGPKPKTARVCS